MRWIKRLLVVAVGLVVVVAVVLVAVVLLVDPNDYKDDIAKLVREQTGRELKLAGDLKLSVFPSVAIEVHDASLGNPPGFGTDPFVAIGEAKLVMRLWPLLSKHFEVKRVVLTGLKAHLVTNKAGKGNWEGLGGDEAEKPATTTESASSGASATISSVVIQDSEIVMDDERDHSTRRFTKVNLSTGQLGDGDPVPVELSLSMDSGSGSKPTPISFKSPGIDLDLDDESLDVPEFALRFGDLDFSGSVKGKKVLSDHELSGALKLAETSLRDTMAQFSGSPVKTRDEKAFTRVGFDSKFALTAKRLDLSDFKARLDDTQLEGSFAIADLDSSALVFDLKADQLNVDRYLAPEEKAVAGAKAPPVTLPLETLKSLNARGSLQLARMEFSGLTLEGVALKVNAAGGDVKLGPTQAKLYGGTYRGNVNIDARSNEAKVTLDQHLASIDFAKLLAAAYDSKRFSGKGAVNISVTGHGRTDADIKRTLNGDLDFDVKDGALEGKDLWFELRRARALIKREAAPEGGDTGRTKFDALKSTGKFVNGTLSTDDLLMQTQFLKVTGNGTVALPTSAVDLHVNAKVYQVPPSGAGAEMKDMKTAADIPVRVTGTLTDYKIRPDFEAALKGEVKEKVKEKKEELKKKARDKLRELLGG
jgi:AsmA protein